MKNELSEKLKTNLLQSIGKQVYVDEELQSLDEKTSTYTQVYNGELTKEDIKNIIEYFEYDRKILQIDTFGVFHMNILITSEMR